MKEIELICTIKKLLFLCFKNQKNIYYDNLDEKLIVMDNICFWKIIKPSISDKLVTKAKINFNGTDKLSKSSKTST